MDYARKELGPVISIIDSRYTQVVAIEIRLNNLVHATYFKQNLGFGALKSLLDAIN